MPIENNFLFAFFRKENIKIQQYYKIICGKNIFQGVGFFKDNHLCPKRMMKR